MIRILHCVNDMHRAGLETVIMNYYRSIDRTEIQFDFLTHRPQKADYDDEILALGGRIYRAPRLYPKNYPAYFRYMKQFWADHPEYRIVHSHIDAMSFLPLLTAKLAGVPVRIAHSHSTGIDPDYKYLLKQLFRLNLNHAANYRIGCGRAAGDFLFRGSDYALIPNAIEAERFLYDNALRLQKRRELGLEGHFVIGHIGRLTYPKNHDFLLEIFQAVLRKRPEAVLLLIGAGERKEAIEKKIGELSLGGHVFMLGVRQDTAQLYQAMDAFVLPSIYEGIPVVGVEAQFADLPCFFSDNVSDEVVFSPKSRYLSLKLGPEAWAEAIASADRDFSPRGPVPTEGNRYSVRFAHRLLADYYRNLPSGGAGPAQDEESGDS